MKISPDQKIAIVGSGELGRAIYSALRRKLGPHTMIDICDSRLDRTGNAGISGMPEIVALESISQNRYDHVIMGFNATDDEYTKTRQSLEETFHCPVFSSPELFRIVPEIRGWPVLDSVEAIRLRNAFDFIVSCFSDQESVNQFTAYYDWVCKKPGAAPAEGIIKDQYFVDKIIELSASEVFADFGAYNGDTLRIFLERTNSHFTEYYAFEPDYANFDQLVLHAAALGKEVRSRLRLFNAAITDRAGYIRFDTSASQNSRQEHSLSSGNWVQGIPFSEVPFRTPPSFIKLDLEGNDLPALFDGVNCIVKWRPKLCVAIYHKPRDFLDIPLLLMGTLKNYSFFVRAHNRFALDFVLYCIPNS